jgi:predicted MFS family arabinose efflux permease
MVHNTLQVNATQMAPQARATAIGLFSSALYVGQAAGVAAAAPIFDRYGAVPIFMIAVAAWPLLCWWLSAKLRARNKSY